MGSTAFTFGSVSGFSGFSGYPGNLLSATYVNTFSAGQAIYRVSGGFALAQANAVSSSDVIGIIQNASASAVYYVANGYVTGLTGLVDGAEYWLSDTTAGALVSAQPTSFGSVIKPLLIATSTSTGVVVEYPGALIGGSAGTSGYYGKWTGTQNIGTGLLYDTGTNIGVGTTTPNQTFTVVGNISATGTVYGGTPISKSVGYSMFFGW